MAGPVKKSKDGIVSRVVFFIVAIGIALGAFQWLTGGIKVGEDGWFGTGHEKISEIFQRGSDATHDKLEEVTDGAGNRIGNEIRDQFSTPTPAPAPGGGDQ